MEEYHCKAVTITHTKYNAKNNEIVPIKTF